MQTPIHCKSYNSPKRQKEIEGLYSKDSIDKNFGTDNWPRDRGSTGLPC